MGRQSQFNMMPHYQNPYMRPGTGIQVNRRIGELPVELEPLFDLQRSQPQPQYQQFQTNSGVRLREVSETDLYLLGAIEKLVYRVDYLESRLRRTEQLVYFLMAGNNQKETKDPCPVNFTRVGDNCYLFSDKKANWKNANSACKALGGHLTEFEKASENEELMAYLLNHPSFKGKDYWLGGLNPGLLWIWAGSAKPVNPNTNLTSLIKPTPKPTLKPTLKPTSKPTLKPIKSKIDKKPKMDEEDDEDEEIEEVEVKKSEGVLEKKDIEVDIDK
uniref:C-type lectin domain-containing protein n=1 Tax=Megaselia scalaris TaxID=36166 RepID=T1GF18_MEGSC